MNILMIVVGLAVTILGLGFHRSLLVVLAPVGWAAFVLGILNRLVPGFWG